MLLVVCQLGSLQFNFSDFTPQVRLCFVEKKKRKLFVFKNVRRPCSVPVSADYDSVAFMYVGHLRFYRPAMSHKHET